MERPPWSRGPVSRVTVTVQEWMGEQIRKQPDLLGEICNMVAGSFKAQLSDIATQCMLSVPTVVSGKDYELYPLADGLRIQVSRSFEEALVWMTLDLHGG